MLKEIAIGTEVLVVAEGETLIHIEAHDTEDLIPKNLKSQKTSLVILVEVMDDLVVVDSKEQGRAIRFYTSLKDETDAPDRDVLAMLKEIAIGTEVLVVAEGETLIHIEAHDTKGPLTPKNLKTKTSLFLSR